jgi:hypothetical protein
VSSRARPTTSTGASMRLPANSGLVQLPSSVVEAQPARFAIIAIVVITLVSRSGLMKYLPFGFARAFPHVTLGVILAFLGFWF